MNFFIFLIYWLIIIFFTKACFLLKDKISNVMFFLMILFEISINSLNFYRMYIT